MKHYDTGRLKAYRDGALAPVERAAVAAHLASCPACQQELAILNERARSVAHRLAVLGPTAAETPTARQALARFHKRAEDATPTSWGLRDTAMSEKSRSAELVRPVFSVVFARRLTMIKETFIHGRLRPFAIGAAALACLLILFSFAPVRQVAADFLGIFRVRKFAVIPIDQTQQQKLENLAQQAEGGRFGKPTMVREPGKPQPAADLAEASAKVGFAVRAPSALPAGATRQSLVVQSGPALHYEMDRAIMQALLDATQAQGIKLPPTDKITLDIDVPYAATQEYALGASRLTVTQMSSPQVNIPPGLDLIAIGEAGFKFLGMPDADARRLAQSIDWTSTLVIPLPTNVVQYREVTVDGVPGLLVEHRAESGSRRTASLLWQKNGVLYSITTKDVDPLVAMQVADSLR